MSSERPRSELHGMASAAAERPNVSPFLCPGGTQPVSRALHLARLNAAWPTCDQCEWRHDTEGLAQKTIEVTDRIRDHRAIGIQRTEFGVRGQYINELDRKTASELARLFCVCLYENSKATDQAEAEEARRRETANRSRSSSADRSAIEVKASFAELQPVVVGYDGRSSSPDIFVGVTAAVREFGLPLIDLGRCTAASIQEAARSQPGCSGAIFVTGSGSPASWTGLDVSDAAGDPVPVVWKDFGVRLQHVSLTAQSGPVPNAHQVRQPEDRLTEMLNRMRSENRTSPKTTAETTTAATSHLRLLLPPLENRSRWLARLGRHSGEQRLLDFEPTYRQWLRRWYPEKHPMRVHVRSEDVLVQQRVAWLAEQTQLELICRSIHDSTNIPSCRLTLTIHEDDRFFSLQNFNGDAISAERLAAMINVAIHSQASQVTAHTDTASGRFWLTDASRSSSLHSTEHVRDGLAVLGLVSRLMTAGRISL